MNKLLNPKILISTVSIFVIGIVLGIFIPTLLSNNTSAKTIGNQLVLNGDPQTPGLNIPLSTIDASANGWIDPMLCAPGRGRYFTKEDSANLVVLYNNAETISGVYLRSDSEMPAPWKKTDAL